MNKILETSKGFEGIYKSRHDKDSLSPRVRALRRVLKRRSYSDQKSILQEKTARVVAPGEEMDLARAGLQLHPREVLKPEMPHLRLKEKLPSDFKKMWEAHPHSYQEDESQNTSRSELSEQIGFPSDWNTCAIRLSVMLNKLGLKITPAKVKAAGIKRPPYYSKKTKEYYIISAKEMWTYLKKNFRSPDKVFPSNSKTYKDSEEFNKAFESNIKPIVEKKKGIVAFEKIFGYGGTGHVDLFDGLNLSAASSWFPCMRLHLWYIEVPERGGEV